MKGLQGAIVRILHRNGSRSRNNHRTYSHYGYYGRNITNHTRVIIYRLYRNGTPIFESLMIIRARHARVSKYGMSSTSRNRSSSTKLNRGSKYLTLLSSTRHVSNNSSNSTRYRSYRNIRNIMSFGRTTYRYLYHMSYHHVLSKHTSRQTSRNRGRSSRRRSWGYEIRRLTSNVSSTIFVG